MGNMSSEERIEAKRQDLDRFVKQIPKGPDLKVNKSIKMFTSLESSDHLRQHYETRKIQVDDYIKDWIKNLADKLANLESAPKLAGLGALAVAVFIDVISMCSPEESTKDVLQSVFAEEKASEVWDQIDECLKRCMMHINDDDQLRSNIGRIECQLSAALTKLKNSMVRDGHMSTPALKAWVNGAVFHVQMLIHLVRLGGTETCDPVERLISLYQRDLDSLFQRHREMIRGNCYMDTFSNRASRALGPLFPVVIVHWLVNEDSQRFSMGDYCTYDEHFEAYYDHRYGSQKCEIQQYFSDVSQNLEKLVNQIGSFSV